MARSDSEHDRDKPYDKRKQQNAFLTFAGEHDAEFFAVVLKAVSEMSADECGGSRELSVRAENGNIVVGYKMELNI